MPRFRKVPSYDCADALAAHAASLGIGLPVGRGAPSQVLASPWSFTDRAVGEITVGNRFTVLPMEGWDGGDDGAPTELVRRRWLRFAESGAKLLWFEATAVSHEGRANPRQLVLDARHLEAFASLRAEAVARHVEVHGSADGLVTGLQLTHSGRWCRPVGPPSPHIVYRHPELDARAGVEDDLAVMSDAALDALVERFVATAELVERAGFDFVDVKHCHGYLAHELLSAYDRPGRYGGPLENRTRFLRDVVGGIRERCPRLAVAVRLSAFDVRPFRAGEDGVGVPASAGEYRHGFGADASGLGIDFDEVDGLVATIAELGIGLLCVTAGSPYYCPHVQRPAFYPPSDGYQPPEDPVLGVARLLDATRHVNTRFPSLGIVGTGFTYLQEHLPAVASGCIELGWMDSVGLGRSSLSYPNLPADVLAGRAPAHKLLCRTFSDCTTAPRNGLVSGCYPLDELYRKSDGYARLKAIKKQ
ncbi:MAG: NADH:flavin oxidoreductase [Ectothiorhodospiraceae bacterium]|nr:NADH:flavin oxidoreductase [Ectothiorhodospiraceae bacterium]